MTQRYRRSPTDRTAEREQRERERLRQELREDLLRELRGTMQSWLKDIERDFAQSFRDAQSGSRSRSDATTGADTLAGFGTSLAKLAFGLVAAQTRRPRTETTTGAITETGRSQEENRFYRESISQREAAAAALAQKGQRGL